LDWTGVLTVLRRRS